jgi:hypothetical protein
MKNQTATLLTTLFLSACASAAAPEGTMYVSGLTGSVEGSTHELVLFVNPADEARALALIARLAVVRAGESADGALVVRSDELGIEIYDPDGDPARDAVVVARDADDAEELYRLLKNEPKYLSGTGHFDGRAR